MATDHRGGLLLLLTSAFQVLRFRIQGLVVCVPHHRGGLLLLLLKSAFQGLGFEIETHAWGLGFRV